MTTHHTPEIEFRQILADFRAAVALIAEPQTVTTIQGVTAEVPPLVEQIDLVQRRDHGAPISSPSATSRPPIWVGGHDWIESVRNALSGPVRGWQGVDPRSPIADLLSAALWGSWGTSAAEELARATPLLNACRWAGLRLLHPQLFTVSAPCPECGERYSRTGDRINGIVKVDAISVHDLWASCSACGATWWGIDIVELLAPAVLHHDDDDANDEHDENGDGVHLPNEAIAV